MSEPNNIIAKSNNGLFFFFQLNPPRAKDKNEMLWYNMKQGHDAVISNIWTDVEKEMCGSGDGE